MQKYSHKTSPPVLHIKSRQRPFILYSQQPDRENEEYADDLGHIVIEAAAGEQKIKEPADDTCQCIYFFPENEGYIVEQHIPYYTTKAGCDGAQRNTHAHTEMQLHGFFNTDDGKKPEPQSIK